MSITTPLVTVEQLWGMPDDGVRRELLRGEIIMMTPAGFQHSTVAMTLAIILGGFVREKALGLVAGADAGFVLSRDPDTVLVPDLAFVRQSRIDEIGVTQKFFPGPPCLAVEVRSPGDTASEAEAKTRDWLAYGVQVVWVVEPQRRIVTVYRTGQDARMLTEGETLESPDLLPGLKIRIRSFL